MSNTTFEEAAREVLEKFSGSRDYPALMYEESMNDALEALSQLHQQETLKKEKEAFKAGVAMSGGDLKFQETFYKQWCTNLNNTEGAKDE